MNSSAAGEPASGETEFARNLELLRQTPFFSGLPLEPLKVLAYLARREVFRPGEHLFRRDDQDGRAYYLVSGRAEVLLDGPSTAEQSLTLLGPGAFLGSLSLLADTRRLFGVRALERTECLVLTREQFARTMAQFPDIAPKVLEAVVKAVRDWEQRVIGEHADLCEVCSRNLGVSLV